MLEIRRSARHGRGVFTTAPIAAGDVLEVAPALLLSAQETDTLGDTTLAQYIFHWDDGGRTAVAFGYVSLCNHEDPANAEVVTSNDPPLVHLVATEAIPAEHEVLIDYGPDHPIPHP